MSLMHSSGGGTTRRAFMRSGLLTAAAASGLCFGPKPARAAYPERPITLIVPFAPGGPTDIVARILSTAFQTSLGQSVVVENRAGAAGNIGMTLAARAAPDGYTLLLASTAIAVNPALFNNLAYDPFKDFTPISELVNAPNVLVVKPGTGINTVADLVARAKAAPGTFNYSSPGSRHEIASHRRAAQAACRHPDGARALSRRRARCAGRARRHRAGRLGGARRRGEPRSGRGSSRRWR